MHEITNSQHIAQIAMQSPYPPSVDGSGFLYFSSLTSLWFMSIVAAVMFVRKVQEIWADRKYSKWSDPISAWRMIICFWMLTAFIRNLPEVVYLMSFGEVSAYTSTALQSWKRIADTIAPLSFMSGITLILLADEQISFYLKSPMLKSSFDITSRTEKVKDIAYLLGGVSLMSAIIWAAKYYN